MSQLLLRRPRDLRLVAFALLALAALPLISTAGPAAAATGTPAATSATDTGRYYVFRTRDTGKAATNEQNTRCNRFFGARALTTITRLNALLFAYEASPATGRIENQTKSLLGPGFICAAPALSGHDQLDAYAYSSLPGPGLVEASGSCNLASVVVENLPFVLNCVLQVKPNPAKGITGGTITSNSLVNTINRSASAPTGSVWTAHILGPGANPGGGETPVPPGIKPETPGLDFYTVRTGNESVSTSSPSCLNAGVAPSQLAIRSADLSSSQPDPISGQVSDLFGPSVGKLTVCYLYAGSSGYRVAAVATLKTSTGTFDVKARGGCKITATIAGPDLREQSCSLTITPGAVRGGLITSNGLIKVGEPASAASSAVWTFALFGSPAA